MTDERPVYLLPGLRSPFVRIDRELARFDGLELSVPTVQQTVGGAAGPGVEHAADVDLFLWGSVIPSLRVANWAREVWLEAGLDPHVPAQSVVQQCATSLAATTQAAAQIATGHANLVLCGGVESMSSTPVGLSRGLSRALRRAGTAGGPADALRQLRRIRFRDVRLTVPAVEERTTGKSMGEHCEEMAKEWEIEREAQDEVALASHRNALAAEQRGFFRPLLVTPGTFPIDADTIPRADTSLEALAGLRPAFDRTTGTLTAGNSSPLTDGSAACWVASEEGLERLPSSLPRVRLLDWEQAAIDPATEGLLMAPALALPRLLARHGLGYSDIALWEVHEAFAAQVLCTVRALEDPDWIRNQAGVDVLPGRVPRNALNPNGGSVALGHPFAATGARILSQAATELAARGPGALSLVSVCAAGGLGHVALLRAE